MVALVTCRQLHRSDQYPIQFLQAHRKPLDQFRDFSCFLGEITAAIDFFSNFKSYLASFWLVNFALWRLSKVQIFWISSVATSSDCPLPVCLCIKSASPENLLLSAGSFPRQKDMVNTDLIFYFDLSCGLITAANSFGGHFQTRMWVGMIIE